MFVNEYRNLLADRLLQSLNYDISREVHDVHGNDLGPILQDSLGMRFRFVDNTAGYSSMKTEVVPTHMQ